MVSKSIEHMHITAELKTYWLLVIFKSVQAELEELRSERKELLDAYNSTQLAQETASEKIQVG